MARQSGTLIERVEKIVTGTAALLLLLAAAVGLLAALGDPNAPARCFAGAAETMTETLLCLSRAGYDLPGRLAFGAIGLGLFAGVLASLRSRAEDRAVAGSMRTVMAASAEVRQREPA